MIGGKVRCSTVASIICPTPVYVLHVPLVCVTTQWRYWTRFEALSDVPYCVMGVSAMGTSGQPAVARIHARIGPSAVRLTLSPPTRLLFPCAHMMVLSRSCRHRVFIWVDISLLSRFHSGLRLSKHTEISHTEPSWGCGWGRMARAGRETRQIIAPPSTLPNRLGRRRLGRSPNHPSNYWYWPIYHCKQLRRKTIKGTYT